MNRIFKTRAQTRNRTGPQLRPGSRFQRADLQNNFKDIREVHFLRFEWQKFKEDDVGNFVYLGYRTSYLISIFAILYLSSECTFGDWSLHALYFTQWSLFIQTFYGIMFFGLVAFNSGHHCYYRDEQPDEIMNPEYTLVLESRPLGFPEKTIWFLHSISIVFSYMCFLYWLCTPNAERHLGPLGKCNEMVQFDVLVVTAIISTIELSVTAIPIRMGHATYAMVSAASYVMFALIYEMAGGSYDCEEGEDCKYIYPFFDWTKRPGHAALAFLGLSLLPGLIFVIVFGYYKLRLYLLSITFKKDAFLDHQYPFHISTSQMDTSRGYFGLTDPENPFPRRILINDGLPITRIAALAEIQKLRIHKGVPNPMDLVDSRNPRTKITPFPPEHIIGERDF